MECPKCGFTGDDPRVCPACGIVFEKYLARKRMAQNPEDTVRAVVGPYSRRFQGTKLYFKPNFPSQLFVKAYSTYPAEEAPGESEEVLVMLDLGKGGARNALLTTRRLLRAEPGITGEIQQLELASIKQVKLEGLMYEKLIVNGDEFGSGALSGVDEARKQLFIRMLREIGNALGQNRGAVKRLTKKVMAEYPSMARPALAGGVWGGDYGGPADPGGASYYPAAGAAGWPGAMAPPPLGSGEPSPALARPRDEIYWRVALKDYEGGPPPGPAPVSPGPPPLTPPPFDDAPA